MDSSQNDFDRLAVEYDFWMRTATPPDEYKKIVGFLPTNTESVLDVGCGTGSLALFLADYARRVTGIDSAAAMIRLAQQNQREQAKPTVDFIHADTESWDPQDMQFDFIVGDKALHHTDLDLVLPRLRGLLRPGGWIWIRDFTTDSVERRRSPVWQYGQAIRELFGLKGQTWKDMVWLARFRLSSPWISHICHDNILSPQQTIAIYRRHFPDCPDGSVNSFL